MNEPSPNVKFSLDEVLQILKNAGVDVTCGACAEVAFTGATLATHTCSAVGKGVGFLSTARQIPKGCTISIEGNRVLIRADEVILGYIENKGGGMYQWRSMVRDACAHEILNKVTDPSGCTDTEEEAWGALLEGLNISLTEAHNALVGISWLE